MAEGHAAALPRRPQERGVEPGVMGHQHRVFSAELVEHAQRFRFLRRSGHHLVGNARKLGYLRWYGLFRVDKCVKTVQYLTIFHPHRAYLCYVLLLRRKPRGLKVEADKLSVQLPRALAYRRRDQIIDKIGLRAIYDLKIRVLLIYGLLGVHCVREGLSHPVVGDGYGPLAPLIGLLYQLPRRGYAVHLRHAGVQVQLHPLFIVGGVVHYLHLVHRGYGSGAQHILPVVFVILQAAAHKYRPALLQLIQLLALARVLYDLKGRGAGIVRYVYRVYLLRLISGLLALYVEYLPPDHGAAQVQAQLPNGHGLALRHLSQQRPGRLRDHLRQKVIPLAHLYLALGGLPGHGLLIGLHLLHHGLPPALLLLVMHHLQKGSVPLLHRKLTGKLNGAVNAEPVADKPRELPGGAPGSQQLIAAVGQGDGQLTALKVRLGPPQAAVKGRVPLLQCGGKGVQLSRVKGLRRKAGLHRHPSISLSGHLPPKALKLAVLHKLREPHGHPHRAVLTVNGKAFYLPLQKRLGKGHSIYLLLKKRSYAAQISLPLPFSP